jgi:hypothetical protein
MFGIDEELERLLAEDPGLVMDELDFGKVHIQSPEPIQYPQNPNPVNQFAIPTFLTVPAPHHLQQVRSLPEDFATKEVSDKIMGSLHGDILPDRMTASLSNLNEPLSVEQVSVKK